jgi:hypothetical protein
MKIPVGYTVHATQPQPNGQWTFMFIKGTQARLLQPSLIPRAERLSELTAREG